MENLWIRNIFMYFCCFVIWMTSRIAWSFQNYPNPSMHHSHSQHLNNIRMQQHKENNLWRTLHSIDPHADFNKPKPKVRDFATIKNPPKNITRKMDLKVEYQCAKPQVIALMVDGFEDGDKWLRNSTNPLMVADPEVFFQTAWRCEYSEATQETTIKVKMPSRFLFRPSIDMLKASQLDDVTLKIFLVPVDDWVFVSSSKDIRRNKMQLMFEKSRTKLHLPLVMPPPLERPRMKRKRCLTWDAKLVAQILKQKPPKTVVEEECTDLISFPAVMSEEAYGVISGFYPYYNTELQRMKHLNRLRLTLTMELYLFSHCETGRLCSLFQHIDFNDQFESPILLISQQGKLHLQLKLSNNNSYAHTSAWTVPVRQWVRINYYQTNVQANVSVSFGRNFTEKQTFTATFQMPVTFEDHKGYITAGGSNYCKNINGIISYARFCRNKALTQDQVTIPPRPAAISGRLLKAYKKQQQTLRKSIRRRWQHFSDASNIQKDVCIPYFLELVQNATRWKQNSLENQTPAISDAELLPAKLANVEEVLNDLPSYVKSKDVLTQTKMALYKAFLKKLENPSSMKNMTDAIHYLKQAARLGDGVSHFFLFSIYKNGIGMEKNLLKAKFHLLLGAHLGDNLCLKALAFNHLHGYCGFPADINLAFFYYFNLAHKTQKDLLEHSEGQASVNLARLTDEKQMKEQLSEGDDLFQWIKHQAAKGAYSAQRNMGRLLYWGQQGLQRNLEAAFKYYEEAAKGGDPVAMYDYGLVLIKGHGTEADTAKGIEVLQQAAEVENPGALNTLGWYYATEKVNMTKAVEYFEKADKLGSIDAAYNLGYMHHTGKYPGKERDMKTAFTKYYRAASGGHIEAGLQVSHLMATGIEDYVPRNPQAAVQWAKYLSEKNPTMGEVVREGLQAYRKKLWGKALFIYMSVAETGFEVAQYNTAFLCEADDDEIVKYIDEDCVWKNWNASTLLKTPHPYALNKMGDFHYYGHGGASNLKEAVRYYGLASKLKFPQAIFNLASIMEEHGNVVKNETLKELDLPDAAFQSTDDAIVHLYRKCTEIESSETSLPCYLALLRTQSKLMWERTSLFAKVITLVVIFLTTLILILINFHRRRSQLEQMRNSLQQETRLENGTFPTTGTMNQHEENNSQTHIDPEDPVTVTEEHEE